jgi:hypothetical protein
MVRFTKVTNAGRDFVYGIGAPTEHSPMGALLIVARKKGGRWLVVTGTNFDESPATAAESAALEALPNDGASEDLMRTRWEQFEQHARGKVN